jgi:hypothetical protein
VRPADGLIGAAAVVGLLFFACGGGVRSASRMLMFTRRLHLRAQPFCCSGCCRYSSSSVPHPPPPLLTYRMHLNSHHAAGRDRTLGPDPPPAAHVAPQVGALQVRHGRVGLGHSCALRPVLRQSLLDLGPDLWKEGSVGGNLSYRRRQPTAAGTCRVPQPAGRLGPPGPIAGPTSSSRSGQGLAVE